jgi:hypothetical protein
LLLVFTACIVGLGWSIVILDWSRVIYRWQMLK